MNISPKIFDGGKDRKGRFKTMAAKEIKSISVAPVAEEDTINEWQSFGWELKSSQEIKNKDSHLERRGDDLVSVTETEHYVKLTFERDPARQNYAELVSLQREYESIPNPSAPPKRFGIFFLIIMGLSLIFGIGFFGQIGGGAIKVITMLVAGLVFLAPGVLIFLWRMKRYKKLYPEWENSVASITARNNDVLNRARDLV
jgi:hypothetical protein